MTSIPAPGRPARRPRIVHQEMYETVFGAVYAGLAANLLLALAALPVLALLLGTDVRASWPALVLVAPLLGPALVATFGAFAAFSDDGSTAVVRAFARAYRRHFRRAVAVGGLGTTTLLVLAVDGAAAWGSPIGAAAIPVLAVLGVLALATTVIALAAVPELPGARLRDVLRASLYVAVRRWYLSGPALLVLALLAGVVTARPAVGLGLAAAPLLFAVWGAARYALRTTVPSPADATRRARPKC
ncbi:ferredoxin-NADPH reductase [Isoptericola sp. F-RaC21]|uniref:ferredoxin-NADPH reductase n=1 Tax=Isoptericola sp. F-RaC21 TaxID=3141452 RepID=UPI00315BE42C